MHAVVVHRGKHYIVKALENENGKCYFLEFYDDELEQSEKKKVLKLIEFFADKKTLHNETKFRKLEKGGEFFELKPHPVRLLGFYHGQGVFIITHGFKKGEPLGQEKEKAQDRRRRFLISEVSK